RHKFPDDTGLAVAEAELLAERPEVNGPLVASAVAALLAPHDAAALALHADRLRRGLAWNLERADQLLHAHAFTRPRAVPEAQLGWAQWLVRRGRRAEAAALLEELAAGPAPSRGLQLLRGRLLLVDGRGPELSRLLRDLEKPGPDVGADLLHVRYLMEMEQS